MAYHLLRRPWRSRKIYYSTMVPEIATIVALLVLFGLAQPNTYRTLMWQIGYNNRFNSNPNMILYAYANHQPLPTIPFVWSQAYVDLSCPYILSCPPPICLSLTVVASPTSMWPSRSCPYSSSSPR